MDKEIINKNTSWAFQTDPVHSYAYFLKAFSIEECENIIKIGKNKTLKKGTIFAGEIEKIRNSQISWLYPDDGLVEIFKKITDIILMLNQKYFNFDLFGITEGLQFTNYTAPSGNYGKHVDRSFSIPIRKLSMSIQLSNPNEYEGGDLLLHEGEEGIPLLKEQGTLLLFPSYILHEVTPVTKGERNSLVTWITGTPFK
jgi:PKHD-type hydroxylase